MGPLVTARRDILISVLYQPFYCEENIWHLAAARRETGLQSTIALISNQHRQCAVWNQRAAPRAGEPIVWDYHVILIDEQGGVHDLDTLLGAPVPLHEWVSGSFAPLGLIQARYEPRFLLLDGDTYLARFSSDRSHMRTKAGRFRHAPPSWPPIIAAGEPHFFEWLDESGLSPGRWVDREGLSIAIGG